ncbi:xylulokinase [Listeria ivanovii]|uniref:xylulokinase n=2 Tax=Listeria ivanovii TaxID=1638 RepID=UPI000DAA6FE7|nr:xylulokinase [Listeria ivanovii]PZF87937.1 xylulokinase [Listeria ivanovii]PZF93138.1 xylulokinase [Listeria ivanovii]PZG04003.1 xylulokinase [Listeria ivanovii]PZG08386.1 xylulokinase [Listeria ivanovii]PZG25258.1 xylulokinase [Listeria ivanovii]
MGYVLGIDLGTSSLKGIVMNKAGNLIAEASTDYAIDSPAPGFSEQHPEYWVIGLEKVMTKLGFAVADFGAELEAISFSGQMHSLVMLGAEEKVVHPAILWNDVRTTKQCTEIMEEYGDEIINITKNIVLEGFTLPKILWLKQNKPEVWAKVRKIMLPKDYLAFVLTGNMSCEYSDAAGTSLFDIEKQKWSTAICDKFEIDNKILPTVVSSLEQVGVVKEEYANRFGLKQAVKVFAGGADNACAALGAGIVNEDYALVSLGTSGVFSAFERDIVNYQGKLHFFNHIVSEVYYSMGVTLAAGNSLNWFKNTFGKGLSFQELLAGVHTVAPGSEGLLFTPYIVGERTPHIDAKIRGSFIGIDTRHELKHFARAVLEGITFSLKDAQVLMEAAKNKKFKRIISVGGGARNSDWMQMQADIFNAEIIRLEVEQGPGVGACMIAAVGTAWFKDFESCRDVFVQYKKDTFKSKKENVEKYRKLYDVYRAVYPATKKICATLTNLK